jgi:hypothetical protein
MANRESSSAEHEAKNRANLKAALNEGDVMQAFDDEFMQSVVCVDEWKGVFFYVYENDGMDCKPYSVVTFQSVKKEWLEYGDYDTKGEAVDAWANFFLTFVRLTK